MLKTIKDIVIYIIIVGGISVPLLWCVDKVSDYYHKHELYDAIDASTLTQEEKDAFKNYIKREF